MFEVMSVEHVTQLQILCKRFYFIVQEYIWEIPIKSMDEHLIIRSVDEGTLMPSFRDKIYKVTWRESKNKELEFK